MKTGSIAIVAVLALGFGVWLSRPGQQARARPPVVVAPTATAAVVDTWTRQNPTLRGEETPRMSFCSMVCNNWTGSYAPIRTAISRWPDGD